MAPAETAPLSVTAAGTVLAGESSGEGAPVLALHGLTATRRYVLMGSRALERSGHRVISYDARAHGSSAPAAEGDYGYARLAADALAVLDAAGERRAVLAGASMGAHAAVRVALEHPGRVAGLVLITPAFDPRSQEHHERWDALARGLREGGVEGFLAAYDLAAVPEAWRETVGRVLRQRLSAHEHPAAVADALERVPRSRPFEDWCELASVGCPCLVVGSRDEADPGHPLAVARAWQAAIPGARLVVEDEGPPARSPVAWQGGRVAALIAEVCAVAYTRP